MSGADKPVLGERIALQNVGNRRWSDQISGPALGKVQQNTSAGRKAVAPPRELVTGHEPSKQVCF